MAPQYAFNKSRASDDSTKIIDPSFSVHGDIKSLDKFSYVPNLHDVATILLMTKHDRIYEEVRRRRQGCFEYA
jgi:hypothetical protein